MKTEELAQEIYRIASVLELYSIKITTTQECKLPDFKYTILHTASVKWGVFGQNELTYDFYMGDKAAFEWQLTEFKRLVEDALNDPNKDEINRLLKI